MAHNYQPNQRVRILPVLLAVSADASEDVVADTISAILTESGLAGGLSPDPVFLDWQYNFSDTWEKFFHDAKVVQLSDEPEEGDAFEQE